MRHHKQAKNSIQAKKKKVLSLLTMVAVALHSVNSNTIKIEGSTLQGGVSIDTASFVSKDDKPTIYINDIKLTLSLWADLGFGELIYDTQPKQPTVTLNNLPLGLKYIVSYKDNVNAGTARIIKMAEREQSDVSVLPCRVGAPHWTY